MLQNTSKLFPNLNKLIRKVKFKENGRENRDVKNNLRKKE